MRPSNKKIILWWIKRDIRLSDNQALSQAVETGAYVLPVFVIEPDMLAADDYSPMHWHAQRMALLELQIRLQNMAGDILFLYGSPELEFNKLYKEMPFDAIYTHQETGNMQSFKRDLLVIRFCRQHNILYQEFHQNGVIRRLHNRANRQATIKQRLLLSAPVETVSSINLPPNTRCIASHPLPTVDELFSAADNQPILFDQLQHVSETSAQACLQSFLYDRGVGYSGGISSPNTAFHHGSRLSAHLAWGTLSLRQAYYFSALRLQELKQHSDASSKQWRRSINAFRSRLHWHCHFIQRLETAPEMEFEPLNLAYTVVRYENNPELLQAWQQGKTGFPLVDACMRCLQAIGFLNFRMRAFIVSFAIFGLHLDWRLIHPHLACVFYDYEPGIHLSQLQMQAGIVGINTIRVYSPTKQMIDQDPNCDFIKQWLPELRQQTVQNIQSYEALPLDNYPRPVVDFKQRAKDMKEQIFRIRKSAQGIQASKRVLEKHGSRKPVSKRKKATVDPQISLF